MLKRIHLALAICIALAISACGGQGATPTETPISAPTPTANLEATIAIQSTEIAKLSEKNVTIPVTSTVQPLPQTTSMSPQATLPTSPIAVSQVKDCEPEKWNILPMQVKEETTSPGLKRVVVQFAVENDSQYSGKLAIKIEDYHKSPPTLSTEGGFTYPTIQSPASWSFNTIHIAPSLMVSGNLSDRPIFLTFEVAESQKSYVVHLPYVTIECIYPNAPPGFYDEANVMSKTAKSIQLSSSVTNLPFPSAKYEQLPSISTPVEIQGLGQLEFVGTERDSDPKNNDVLKLNFRFINASAGYKASGYLHGYLIDDLGLVHPIQSGGAAGFDAGPSQSAGVTAEFSVPKSSRKYAFLLWHVGVGASTTKIPIRRAFRIPATHSATATQLDWAELASQSQYFTVYPGDQILPYVIVRNAGTTTWLKDQFGYIGKDEWSTIWGTGKLWRDVKPGETLEFVDEQVIEAPKQPGSYQYGFQLTNDRGQQFGPYFFIQVEVVPRPEDSDPGELRLLDTRSVDPFWYKAYQLTLRSGDVTTRP